MRIETKRGKADKIHIMADGEYAATVDADFWYSSGIGEGSEMKDEDFEDFLFAVEKRRAFNKALNLLSFRDHCSKELYDKLRKFFSEEASEDAVGKMCEMGFIDDENYARKLSFELAKRKNFSPARIRRELVFRGIDREIAEIAAEELDIDCKECIINLLNTKFAGSLSGEKQINRTVNALIRLGYNASDIRSVMRQFDYEDPEF